MRTDTTTPGTSARVIVITAMALAVVAVGMIAVWFFSGDAPAEVDLAETAAAVTTAPATGDPTPTVDGISGTWTIDTTVGDFTVDAVTTATFVGFRVDEELSSVGATVAVGRTPQVSGRLTIDDDVLTTAEISADLTAIVSDESRRNQAIQRSLGTASNPTATFVLTEPIELGPGAADGEAVAVDALGDLTVNGVTNPVRVTLDAQLVDDRILVTGTTGIDFADHGITAPRAPVALSVDDHATVEIQLWLTRG